MNNLHEIKGDPIGTHILNTQALKEALCSQIKAQVEQLEGTLHKRPRLAVIHVGESAPSKVYIGRKEDACHACGIGFVKITLPATIREMELHNEIQKLNKDNTVTGIIVQMPLPEHINALNTVNQIDPKKDVDGLNAQNSGRVVMGLKEETLYPATPLGIMRILDWIGFEPKGKDAVMVGRSHLVGRPTADLLGEREATVMVCHKETKDIKQHTRKADLVVVATGVPYLLKGEDFKKGAVIIDVGISPSHIPDKKIVGDVDTASCEGIASFITPVPGGVGPMTVTSLLTNIIDAFRMQNGLSAHAWKIPQFTPK